MGHVCKYEKCTVECSIFPKCNEEKKLKFIALRESKRKLWAGYRRFSCCSRSVKKINENTVYYNGTKLFNHN